MRILLIVMLLFSLPSLAQRDLKPGYIIVNNGDTIKGLVDYREWDRNPSSIFFESGTYQVRDLKAFGVYDLDHYRTVTVDLDENEVNVSRVNYSSGKIIRDTVIALRVVVQGPQATLYGFEDFKQHYFIQVPGQSPKELGYWITVDSLSTNHRVNNGYKMQLQQMFAPQGLSPELARKLGGLRYSEKSLARFITGMNEFVSHQSSSLKKERYKPVFFGGAGVVYPDFKIRSGHPQFQDMKSDNSLGYIVTVGADFLEPRNKQHFFLRAEISYSQIKGKGTRQSTTGVSYTYEYLLKQTNITPGLSANYRFNFNSRTGVYIGLGAGYNFSKYPQHDYVTRGVGVNSTDRNFPALEKSWVQVDARIGLIVGPNLEIGLTKHVGGSFIAHANFGSFTAPATLRVMYRLK